MPAGLWAGLWAGTLAAAEVLRLHHFLAPNSTIHKAVLEPWAATLERESKGELQVEIYPLMQLGGTAPQLYDQARQGVVDIVWTLPGYTSGRFPVAELFELPFMVSSAAATTQAFQEFSETWLVEEFGETHPLLFHVHARGSFHMRDKPLESLEDLRGLKIRAPSRMVAWTLAELGATPVAMPVPQVPEALARGLLDGALLPWQVTVPLRSSELVRYHTEFEGPFGLYTATFVLTMNKARYQSLPEHLRHLLDANTGRAMAQWVGPLYDRDEELGRTLARERGNQFIAISEQAAEAWMQQTQPVLDRWLAERQAEGLQSQAALTAARRLIAKYEAHHP